MSETPNTPLTPEERQQMEELIARANYEAWEAREAAKATELALYQPLVAALVNDEPVKLSDLTAQLSTAYTQVAANQGPSVSSDLSPINSGLLSINRLRSTVTAKVSALQPSPPPPVMPAA